MNEIEKNKFDDELIKMDSQKVTSAYWFEIIIKNEK
jgi:hypothetical protein